MELSQEDKVRKPVKGLRAKLRQLGVTGKIGTAHHRRKGLLVRCQEHFLLPATFEGFAITYQTPDGYSANYKTVKN